MSLSLSGDDITQQGWAKGSLLIRNCGQLELANSAVLCQQWTVSEGLLRRRVTFPRGDTSFMGWTTRFMKRGCERILWRSQEVKQLHRWQQSRNAANEQATKSRITGQGWPDGPEWTVCPSNHWQWASNNSTLLILPLTANVSLFFYIIVYTLLYYFYLLLAMMAIFELSLS